MNTEIFECEKEKINNILPFIGIFFFLGLISSILVPLYLNLDDSSYLTKIILVIIEICFIYFYLIRYLLTRNVLKLEFNFQEESIIIFFILPYKGNNILNDKINFNEIIKIKESILLKNYKTTMEFKFKTKKGNNYNISNNDWNQTVYEEIVDKFKFIKA